jgi:hypothetical protein
MTYGLKIVDSLGSVTFDSTDLGAMYGGLLQVSPSASGVFRGDGLGSNPDWVGVKLLPLEYQRPNPQGGVNYTQHDLVVDYCKVVSGSEICQLTKTEDRYPRLTYNEGVNRLELTTATTTDSYILLFLGGE